jgi:hypothetical protein
MEKYPRFRLYAVQKDGSIIVAGDFVTRARASRAWNTKTNRGLSVNGIAGVICDTFSPVENYILA